MYMLRGGVSDFKRRSRPRFELSLTKARVRMYIYHSHEGHEREILDYATTGYKSFMTRPCELRIFSARAMSG